MEKIYTSMVIVTAIVLICCVVFMAASGRTARIMKNNTLHIEEKKSMEMCIEKQEKYIQAIRDKDSIMRRFRHDIKGHLTALEYYLQDGELEGAKDYIKEINVLMDKGTVKEYTGIGAADAIISEAQSRMKDKRIELLWNGSMSDVGEIKIFDLCTLFMNILNNAIEACEKLQVCDRQIICHVYRYENKIYIREKNKTVSKVVIGDDNIPVTTKEDKRKHGIGSKNIKDVVCKYNGQLIYKSEDGWFSIEIIL